MKKLFRIILPLLVLTVLSCNKITDIKITPTEMKLEKSKFEKLQTVLKNTPTIVRVFDEEKQRLVDLIFTKEQLVCRKHGILLIHNRALYTPKVVMQSSTFRHRI
jgi:catabolite regulation protein CreA